jgi:hypothetical protein
MGLVKDVRGIFKRNETLRVSAKRTRSTQPNAYVFCDKKTGAAKFTVDADQNGELLLDRIAGSLAFIASPTTVRPGFSFSSSVPTKL